MPHKWENDRKKGSTTSSLKMDRKSNAGNRKSRKFRSISRSLILCNARNSDDGSSPDEKCPDPFEISTNWSQEEFDCCPRAQLPSTSETEDSSPDPPCVITSTAQSKAAANENCNNMRKKLLIKVGIAVYYIVRFSIAVVMDVLIHTSQEHRIPLSVFRAYELAMFLLCINCMKSYWLPDHPVALC